MGFSGPVVAEGCQSSEGDGNSEEKAVKSHFPTRIQNLLPGSPPQHSTTVMDPLPPGVAYRRSPPRKPEFPMFPPPGRAKLPLSRKPSRRLSIFPRPCRVPAHDQTLPAAHRHPEPPGETAATEPLNWLKEQPCDSWAIGNLGSSSRGIQPIPARSRGWRGASLRVTGHWGGACPRAGILVNGRVSDFVSVQGWTAFPALWIPGGQTC